MQYIYLKDFSETEVKPALSKYNVSSSDAKEVTELLYSKKIIDLEPYTLKYIWNKKLSVTEILSEIEEHYKIIKGG